MQIEWSKRWVPWHLSVINGPLRHCPKATRQTHVDLSSPSDRQAHLRATKACQEMTSGGRSVARHLAAALARYRICMSYDCHELFSAEMMYGPATRATTLACGLLATASAHTVRSAAWRMFWQIAGLKATVANGVKTHGAPGMFKVNIGRHIASGFVYTRQ